MVFPVLPGYRSVQGVKGIVGRHGIVGPSRQRDAEIDQVTPDVGVLQTLGSNPGFSEVHVLSGMQRLHGGDDPQIEKPGDVLRNEDLSMFECETGILAIDPRCRQGPFVGVDSDMIGTIANAMDPHVEAHGQQLGR